VSRVEQFFHFVQVIRTAASMEVDSWIPSKLEGMIKMITEGIKGLSSAYSAWFGKSVVLLVAIRQCHVPMPCSIVGESVADVRVRIKPGWEMNLRKELILAVEEYVVARDNRIN
jgi:hypothetical protein